jgi:hypothetical protein
MGDVLQGHDFHACLREQRNFSQQRDLEMIPMWKAARAPFLLVSPICHYKLIRLTKLAF